MRIHPLNLLSAEEWTVIRAWRVHRGGMAPGPLPYSGGWAEQPAGLMGAFAHLDWAEAQLPKPDRGAT